MDHDPEIGRFLIGAGFVVIATLLYFLYSPRDMVQQFDNMAMVL